MGNIEVTVCLMSVGLKNIGIYSIYVLPIGGYHFEIDDGKVRWFHRDESEKTVFSLISQPVVEPKVWMHFAATYDAYKSSAKVSD